jgi:hypothetical protein
VNYAEITLRRANQNNLPFLLALRQQKGTPTCLLRVSFIQSLIDEARKTGASLRLDVLKANPALHLYQRLGFTVVGESIHAYEMRFEAMCCSPEPGCVFCPAFSDASSLASTVRRMIVAAVPTRFNLSDLSAVGAYTPPRSEGSRITHVRPLDLEKVYRGSR